MGRETITSRQPLNVDKEKLEAEYNHMVSMEGWREGSSGLNKSIDQQENTLFENAYEASKYIDELTRKNRYEQVAVKYKDYSNIKKTKAIKQKEKQLENIKSELHDMKTKKHFENHKAKLITCKGCGSKINKDYIRTHTCPLCGENLRSKTDKNKETKLEEKKNKVQADLDKMIEQAKDYEVKWFVQIQYHI